MQSLLGYNTVSDIFNLEHVIQQTGMVHSKNIIIDVLRNVFAQDRQFKYVSDVFGFPKTTSWLGLSPNAGYNDDDVTRIFIGSSYRYDVKSNPSITVRNTGSRYSPIAFNQNLLNIVYRNEVLTDGYGHRTIINVPAYHTLVGAWDQTCEVKVVAENELDREEIADIVQVTLMGTRRIELQKAGVFIKTLSTSGETETPYANDNLYSSSINLDIRTEWKVNIPINDVCERISFSLLFKTMDDEVDDALSVNEIISHADLLDE